MLISDPEIEVVLPVHNEEGSIEDVVREIHVELSGRLRVQFIICEDGSTDRTKEILRRLANDIPMKLSLGDARRGYSQAVMAGMRALTAPYLLCLDSDGQCDPNDFWRLWEARTHADVVVGHRVDRADNPTRRLLSWGFRQAHQLLFRTRLHDPSCPFVVVRRDVVENLLTDLGKMREGFWWEFSARAWQRGYTFTEKPIHHRPRRCGSTQVYRVTRMPGIAAHHIGALVAIWRETHSSQPRR